MLEFCVTQRIQFRDFAISLLRPRSEMAKKRCDFGPETNCSVGSQGRCFGSGQGAVVVHRKNGV